MKVTQQSLRDNGWERWSKASANVCEIWFEKQINPVVCLKVYLPDMNVVLNFDGIGECDLPNLTTMEALSQLEYLLSGKPVADTQLMAMIVKDEIGD